MSIESERRSAVAKAWKNERALVKQGKGTRNWSKQEQKEILSTGKCKGYFGHHKCSVKNNPKQAGNPDNIQFLNSKEHSKAHQNNFKNDPHGRYDPETGKFEKYKGNTVKPEPVKDLSNRLGKVNVNKCDKEYEKLQNEKREKNREYNRQRIKEKAKNNPDREKIKVGKQGTDKRRAKSTDNKSESRGARSPAVSKGKESAYGLRSGDGQEQSKALNSTSKSASSKDHNISKSKGLNTSNKDRSFTAEHSKAMGANSKGSSGNSKGVSHGNSKGASASGSHKVGSKH